MPRRRHKKLVVEKPPVRVDAQLMGFRIPLTDPELERLADERSQELDHVRDSVQLRPIDISYPGTYVSGERTYCVTIDRMEDEDEGVEVEDGASVHVNALGNVTVERETPTETDEPEANENFIRLLWNSAPTSNNPGWNPFDDSVDFSATAMAARLMSRSDDVAD